MLNYCQISDKS